eukprot:Gb_17047 [translate_table: standard]
MAVDIAQLSVGEAHEYACLIPILQDIQRWELLVRVCQANSEMSFPTSLNRLRW